MNSRNAVIREVLMFPFPAIYHNVLKDVCNLSLPWFPEFVNLIGQLIPILIAICHILLHYLLLYIVTFCALFYKFYAIILRFYTLSPPRISFYTS